MLQISAGKFFKGALGLTPIARITKTFAVVLVGNDP
jgi:hypothetical protein